MQPTVLLHASCLFLPFPFHTEAARLRNEPTDSELEEQLAAALAVAEEKKARLQAIKDSGNTVSPDARKNLVVTFKKYRVRLSCVPPVRCDMVANVRVVPCVCPRRRLGRSGETW